MIYKYPLATSSWDENEFNALQEVIKSDRFTMGNEVEEFEKAFAHFFGSKHAVMVNSGSSANLIMIAALRYTNNAKRVNQRRFLRSSALENALKLKLAANCSADETICNIPSLDSHM